MGVYGELPWGDKNAEPFSQVMKCLAPQLAVETAPKWTECLASNIGVYGWKTSPGGTSKPVTPVMKCQASLSGYVDGELVPCMGKTLKHFPQGSWGLETQMAVWMENFCNGGAVLFPCVTKC